MPLSPCLISMRGSPSGGHRRPDARETFQSAESFIGGPVEYIILFTKLTRGSRTPADALRGLPNGTYVEMVRAVHSRKGSSAD